MQDMDMFDSGVGYSHVQGFLNLSCCHVPAQTPGDDVAGIVIQYCREIIPTPVNDLKIRKIRPPQLIDPVCGMLELVFG